MSEESSVPSPKRSKTRVFASWWTQEKFWQDITTRAVSGVLVLATGAVVALALGYLKVPDHRDVAFNVLLGLIGLPVGLVIAFALPGRGRAKWVERHQLLLMIIGLLGFLSLFVYVFIIP